MPEMNPAERMFWDIAASILGAWICYPCRTMSEFHFANDAPDKSYLTFCPYCHAPTKYEVGVTFARKDSSDDN